MKEGNNNITNEEVLANKLSWPAEPAIASRLNRKGSREVEDLLQENDSLRARLSKLSEASRLVSESLDLDIVLQNVVDNARNLTRARYGALLTYEKSGGIQDFITSGLSPKQVERLNTSPQGLGLLGHMNEIGEPLRLSDISRHPSSVGFPDNHPPMKTFLGMPIRHQDEHVGNIYLTEKSGGLEFTNEDQEVLVMFAFQAGAAILNARRYREEIQARADLEALVNISPVGVIVFDAKTGVLVSANDEVRRIFGNLKQTGNPLDQILEVIVPRRADGSDVSIDELPMSKALRLGASVPAEELVLHLPDGRALTTLMNARPIRRDSGEITSVVATIQDITSLEATKRQRIEFMNNVSHEVRTPLSAIKGSTSMLLGSAHPLSPVETRQYVRVIDEEADHMRRLINDLVDITQIESGTLEVVPKPTEIAGLLDQAREAHILDGVDNSPIEIDLPADLPMVMADRMRILQVLASLLDSLSWQSTRSTTLRISAFLADAHVAVSVNSDVEDSAVPNLT